MLAAGNPKLAKLAEEIRFTDPTPCSMDAQIDAVLDALGEDASDAAIDRAMRLMAQRKATAKSEK